MPIQCIKFICTKRQGGYGDRLIGMTAVATIARILNTPFQFLWEPEFMNLCTHNEFTANDDSSTIEITSLGNVDNCPILETEDIFTKWDGAIVAFHAANLPFHKSLWKNPYLQEYLKHKSFDSETRQSFQDLFRLYIRFTDPFPTILYDCGIQIRVGDQYCMPHATAECLIPTDKFEIVAKRMKTYLQYQGIKGKVYVTCDTFHMYKHFTALNDSEYTFVFRDRSDDIHFDWYNSNNRYREVLEDHAVLMNCKSVVTGLRSNFGTTALYSSPYCHEVAFYTSSWKDACSVEYKVYDPRSVLILKEHKIHLTDDTPSTTIHVS